MEIGHDNIPNTQQPAQPVVQIPENNNEGHQAVGQVNLPQVEADDGKVVCTSEHERSADFRSANTIFFDKL